MNNYLFNIITSLGLLYKASGKVPDPEWAEFFLLCEQ